jgi:transposase
VDVVVHCKLPLECGCGGRIEVKKDYQRHQVYELPEIKLIVTEYLLEKGCCLSCGGHHKADLPKGVTWGITGPKLTAFMSHMISKYQLSRRQLKEFLKEHYQFNLSHGTVFNKQKVVNAALENPVSELLKAIKQSSNVNIDETGHNRDGKREWMWGLVSSSVAFFSITASRGRKTLKSLMGDFDNIVISDRYAAYNYFDSSQRKRSGTLAFRTNSQI